MAEHNVQSPLPGTFYRKASPDAPPYAEVGQAVEAGSVIGLIEVMKQFSEVQAGQAGILQASTWKMARPSSRDRCWR